MALGATPALERDDEYENIMHRSNRASRSKRQWRCAAAAAAATHHRSPRVEPATNAGGQHELPVIAGGETLQAKYMFAALRQTCRRENPPAQFAFEISMLNVFAIRIN